MKVVKYSGNPILKPNADCEWENFCVLNPGVIYDEKSKRFIMLYRAAGNDREHFIRLGLATSEDGFHFRRESPLPAMDVDQADADGGCIEDPRIVNLEGRYYITYAARAHYAGRYWLPQEEFIKENGEPIVHPESSPLFIRRNSTVSYLAMTDDFKIFKRLGRITDSRFDDRDVLLFPERLGGKFVRISRPRFPAELNGGAKEPSIWITFSNDLVEWGEPQLLMTGEQWWESSRIGAGCPPIKTEKGWLMIYHGVSKTDKAYRVGMVLLDLNNPCKVLARTPNFVMEPEFDYETSGIYNNCVFPTGNVLKDGILYIYYGCADKYIAVATIPLSEVLDELCQNTISEKNITEKKVG